MQLFTAIQTMSDPTWENRLSCTWIYHCQQCHRITESLDISSWKRHITIIEPNSLFNIELHKNKCTTKLYVVVEMPRKSVVHRKRNIPSPYKEGQDGSIVDCLTLSVSVLLLSPPPVHQIFFSVYHYCYK